jgi:hypothetical protein
MLGNEEFLEEFVEDAQVTVVETGIMEDHEEDVFIAIIPTIILTLRPRLRLPQEINLVAISHVDILFLNGPKLSSMQRQRTYQERDHANMVRMVSAIIHEHNEEMVSVSERDEASQLTTPTMLGIMRLNFLKLNFKIGKTVTPNLGYTWFVLPGVTLCHIGHKSYICHICYICCTCHM